MNRLARLMGLMVAGIFLGGCETPQFQTMSILDTPNRVVALRLSAIPKFSYSLPILSTPWKRRLRKKSSPFLKPPTWIRNMTSRLQEVCLWPAVTCM